MRWLYNMNNEILQKLFSVINVLNTIPVSGKKSCASMCGSIDVLEDIAKELSVGIADAQTEKQPGA